MRALKKIVVGDVYSSNNCGDFFATKYNGANNIEVEFIATGFKITVSSRQMRSGKIKDPMCRSGYGVGRIGVGEFKPTSNQKRTKPYSIWVAMLERCYCKKKQEKNPSYIGCSVNSEWHDFQNFAKWYNENYVDGHQLDKDVLCKGNKVYSPETCRMIPSQINTLLTDCGASRGAHPQGVSVSSRGTFLAQMRKHGINTHIGRFSTPELAFSVYKKAKEQHVKDEAKRHFESGAIQKDIYDALMKWELTK